MSTMGESDGRERANVRARTYCVGRGVAPSESFRLVVTSVAQKEVVIDMRFVIRRACGGLATAAGGEAGLSRAQCALCCAPRMTTTTSRGRDAGVALLPAREGRDVCGRGRGDTRCRAEGAAGRARSSERAAEGTATGTLQHHEARSEPRDRGSGRGSVRGHPLGPRLGPSLVVL